LVIAYAGALRQVTRYRYPTLRQRSGRKMLAALGATTVEDCTPVLCGHSGAKAVAALALQYAGLKRSFHDEISGWGIDRQNKPQDTAVMTGA